MLTKALVRLLAFAFLAGPAASFVAPTGATFVSRNSDDFRSTRHHSSLSISTSSTLDPSETAVVLIEFQNEFTTEGGKLHDAVKECMEATGTLENAKKLMDKTRDAGCTIIHVPIAFEKGHSEISKTPYGILKGVKEGECFAAGEWGSEICDVMKPAEGDIVCKGKAGLCGFHSTNLDFLLRQKGIKNVVLGGFLTNCCVESTMRSAYERGYKVYTVRDACAATSIAGQEAAFEHTFGMFSIPTTCDEVITSIANESSIAA